MRNIRVTVIIPAKDEAENLAHVLPRIPTDVFEVILVDGHSTDGTPEVAKAILPTIRVLTQEGRGKGAALRTGLQAARGEISVLLDADGSTDPAEIPNFVRTLVDGADYAKGSRFLPGAGTTDMTPLRRLGNGAFVMIANVLFGSRFSDITYGYNALWTHHQDKLAHEIDGWANEIIGNIRIHRYGLRIVEVPSFEVPRVAGEAKLRTFPAGWDILKAMFAERFRSLPAVAPARLAVAVPVVGDEQYAAMPVRAEADAFDFRPEMEPVPVAVAAAD